MILTIVHQLYPTKPGFIGLLKKVATLEVGDFQLETMLELAFYETYDSAEPWYKNPLPHLRPEPGEHRSTSLGDIVILDDLAAYQRVEMGWKRADLAIVLLMVT